MWPMGPSENDIQAKMAEIERNRQAGWPMEASQMDAAGQEALKRLMQQPGAGMAPAQPQPSASATPPQPPAGNNIPPSVMGGHNTPPQYLPQQPGMPPQGSPQPQAGQGGPPPQGAPQGSPQANVTPQQGGIWADAEAMQKRRALSGAPTIQ
jgi:hypothetical protein